MKGVVRVWAGIDMERMRGGGNWPGNGMRALAILPLANFSRQQRVTCTASLPGSALGRGAGRCLRPRSAHSSHRACDTGEGQTSMPRG